jgi:hypothetical protein
MVPVPIDYNQFVKLPDRLHTMRLLQQHAIIA